MKRLTKEEIEYKKETVKLINSYFAGNPIVGFQTLKERIRTLRRNGITLQWNG